MIVTKKANLKRLEREMELISNTFLKSKQSFSRNQLRECATSDYNPKLSFVAKVEEAYSKLLPLEQIFINNDFFYEAYPFWWETLFSKKSYLSFKKKAIIHFLDLFYE